MKLSSIIFAVVTAEQKKVPPRHPIQRLHRLTEFSREILNDWFDFLPSKDAWVRKFAKNAERMERNFQRGNQRCGHYHEDEPHGSQLTSVRKAPFDFECIFYGQNYEWLKIERNGKYH